MPVVNRIAEIQDEVAVWRRDIHAHPELLYDVHRTAGLVAEKLRGFGCDEVVTGIGRTGVVGVVHGRGAADQARRVIGLRADMDALPIKEATGLPYQSQTPGLMHACGHDGHTAMLLGAARYLTETRNFAGTAVFVFQPAEEGGGGGRAMVEDGLMDRFGIQEVYGMHNMPNLPVGEFAIRPGAMLASVDKAVIEIEGKGGHAARPNTAIDPIVAGAFIVTQLQTIVSRNVDPLDSAVVSTCVFQAGTTDNVIPQTAHLEVTIRTLRPATRDLVEQRLKAIVEGAARLHGATARVDYIRNYPVTVNHPEPTRFAAGVAAGIVGASQVDTETPPRMAAEDFSYMLEARPGAMIFIGNGDSAELHHPAYDFNDEIIPIGMSYWAKLVETALPA
ncbi:MAG TPA: M20 aminoacylase family protein [Xanthobacteraceae bacterium]|nr:M20 aminoacylase family protein [Xanthobacteraceae bacterium]